MAVDGKPLRAVDDNEPLRFKFDGAAMACRVENDEPIDGDRNVDDGPLGALRVILGTLRPKLDVPRLKLGEFKLGELKLREPMLGAL